MACGVDKHTRKFFSLSSVLTLSAVASAALAAPQDASRLRRDVSELVDASAVDFVPPVTEYLPAADVVDATEQPSAVLGDEGYEYRTVRRLKLRHRNRRDVSHLSTRYLPPPSKNYLPPAAAALPTPAAPADDTEEVVSAVEPKVAREYLPPAAEEVSTEAAPVVAETEAPAVEEEPEPEADVRVVDVPTAELRDDGYHYKQPEEMSVELKEAAPAAPQEYLPPLGDDVVAEGPADGESAVLTKDGYQYRAIRRYRF
ncbi:uncharacterized protein LOC132788271 [Drosophila nasuta]|uniref:uncharacterized protein LOC132788271 n=1 Tax=Drosophila nasuta TaxID=42062 RepID=UPI00295EE9F7|nr:uncharacterized protein LOC132788271 [Drosophila nasuta]